MPNDKMKIFLILCRHFIVIVMSVKSIENKPKNSKCLILNPLLIKNEVPVCHKLTLRSYNAGMCHLLSGLLVPRLRVCLICRRDSCRKSRNCIRVDNILYLIFYSGTLRFLSSWDCSCCYHTKY